MHGNCWPRSRSSGSGAAGNDGRGVLQKLGASSLVVPPGCFPGHNHRDDTANFGGASASSSLRQDLLLARTHGGNFGGVGTRPGTGRSCASTAASSRGGCDAGHSHGEGDSRQFYATAPAGRINTGVVEEATGVRLSNDQLQALRNRYQGSSSNFGGFGAGGGMPSNTDLRQEVFSSIVLRPGQWPKLAADDCGASAGRAARSIPAAIGYTAGCGTQSRGAAPGRTAISARRSVRC